MNASTTTPDGLAGSPIGNHSTGDDRLRHHLWPFFATGTRRPHRRGAARWAKRNSSLVQVGAAAGGPAASRAIAIFVFSATGRPFLWGQSRQQSKSLYKIRSAQRRSPASPEPNGEMVMDRASVATLPGIIVTLFFFILCKIIVNGVIGRPQGYWRALSGSISCRIHRASRPGLQGKVLAPILRRQAQSLELLSCASTTRHAEMLGGARNPRHPAGACRFLIF